MTGGLNKGHKPTEKAPNTNSRSISAYNLQQKDCSITGTASNNETMPPTTTRDNPISNTLNGAPSSQKTFTFTSSQDVNFNFQYQSKVPTTNREKNKKNQTTSGDDTKTKLQAPSTYNTDINRQTPPGVDVALENAILLDDNYTLPRGPKSSTHTNSASKATKIFVPPSKKLVKFVMPYRDESAPPSFDNVRGPSGDGLRTTSYIRIAKKKKKQSVATSAVADQGRVKSKECVLTLSALVELQQLKLRATEADKHLNSIEEQLLDMANVIQNLQARVKASELENSKLRKDLEAFKKLKTSNDNEIDDENDESEQTLWKIKKFCLVLIAAMVVYLVVAYWAT
ncbi:uncharacterized protein DFL_003712 [Arthrobotrys flagrans]|uniref:Uncharacterized protein n=1 Tax=Arthrobotrys flagrans TaxID=97331 RepID=A0A437A2L8_ARTFL|nr:hypothetical protein DFL_003712 [Arthrobotrys flagrans]